MEVWADIAGFEGVYKVSTYGRVKSIERVVCNSGAYGNKITVREKILKNRKDKNGYLNVILCRDGIETSKKVHRLVAEAFIENRENLPIINHIDENPSNNHIENLEWCSYSKNSLHGTAQNRRVNTTKQNRIKRYMCGEYATKSIRRCNFKSICKQNSLDFNDFNEIESNEYYIEKRKDGTEYKHKKFFYVKKDNKGV